MAAEITDLDLALARLEGFAAGIPDAKHADRLGAIVRDVNTEVRYEIHEAQNAKEAAYTERARLVAYLARTMPSSLEVADPSPGFEYVVYIDSPAGQLSWHVADTDLYLFRGVAVNQGRKWDGSDTDEKYARLEAIGQPDVLDGPTIAEGYICPVCGERTETWNEHADGESPTGHREARTDLVSRATDLIVGLDEAIEAHDEEAHDRIAADA